MKKSLLISSVCALALSAFAHAGSITVYTDRASFEAAMDTLTLVDTSANVGKTTSQLSAETPGATFTGPSTFVRSDGLIVNGAGFYPTNPHVGMNFDVPVFGVGATANAFDGGRIQIFSGLNGTGQLLGEAAYGNPSGTMYGGIISDMPILSVVFTCDFNFDLKCGLIDPQFGQASFQQPVPVPAAAPLMVAGLGLMASRRK
ncbi:MAG: hypothetical protein AAF830_15490, partial [Pseudomonadota bacterium]